MRILMIISAIIAILLIIFLIIAYRGGFFSPIVALDTSARLLIKSSKFTGLNIDFQLPIL